MLAVELGLKGAEEEQEKAINEVSVEGENAQTLSLQASELKEIEPLNSTAEQERREEFHEKFEPLRKPPIRARRTEKVTNPAMRHLEEFQKRLRGVPQNTTRDSDSTPTGITSASSAGTICATSVFVATEVGSSS